jgi:hypothetical protein
LISELLIVNLTVKFLIFQCGNDFEFQLMDFEFAATDSAGGFNNSVAEQQAVLETVARVKPKKNDTKEEKYVILSCY